MTEPVTRDLVDRKELRQELELEMPECVDGKIGPDGTLNLETGMVEVLAEEDA